MVITYAKASILQMVGIGDMEGAHLLVTGGQQ
jgi:hypothetical protein